MNGRVTTKKLQMDSLQIIFMVLHCFVVRTKPYQVSVAQFRLRQCPCFELRILYCAQHCHTQDGGGSSHQRQKNKTFIRNNNAADRLTAS